MLWIIPAWLLSLIAAYYLGFYLHKVAKKIEHLEVMVQSKADKKPVVEEVGSTLIDPNDEVAEAIYQHKVMMERLNGKDN